MLAGTKGDPVRDEPNNESLMEETGLGLLPGLVLALGIVVFSMALLLTGSVWAVVGVLLLVALVTAALLAVVIALIDEGELGERLRRYVPGLSAPPRP
jgi:Mg/Co/Ni transporter MgtE